MNPGIVWPDILIGGVVLLLALRGAKRGFVGEVGGLVAIGLAIFAAITYSGFWDRAVHAIVDTDPIVSHWIGMGAYAITVYIIASAGAWIVERVAKLPIIGIGNTLLGAVAGGLKGLLLAWFTIYGLLFFPISAHVRADLHKSKLVALLIAPDQAIDDHVRTNVPKFARSVTDPLFRQHHV